MALLPLVYLLVRTAEAGAGRIAEELFTGRVAVLTARTVALAAVVTAACVVLGVGTAFLVGRTDLPGRRLFAVLGALPLAVPTYIAAFTWVSTLDGFTGFWASAVVLSLCSYPYVYLPVVAALDRADAAQEDVARSLGHNPWRTFRSVTLPQLRPAVAGGALLVALYVLSDFGAVALLRTDTFTAAIFTAFDLGFDRTGALVLATVLVALTTVLLVGEGATRRRDARYAAVGAGARRPHTRLRLGPARLPAALLLAVVAALALGVPALNLARRLAAGVSRPGSLPEIAAAAGNSLTVSAAGAALTLLLALPIGLLVARAPGPLAAGAEGLSYLSHALPGVVIGLSLVFFGVNVAYPLYQTRWLLTLAYAVLFLPLAVAAVSAAVAQAPPVLEDVARSLGRSPARVLATVTVPLTVPGIAAGAALVFLTCMKELPATLLLRPTGMDTLATELWTHTGVAAYAAAAPYAALLVALSAIPTWFLAARTGALASQEGTR
ncbi:ABC transporter permease [Spirilliplanes yamanashiensis]|uniref:ABC transporter permease n=1 Tax=Spirilliplanes yamanashiensis TaxID=42233 RepID=A0A8J3YC37_9ACTN|nr:iron ABC transporter permease [Spirilliplanes yamanashiensis]MDP9818177.1 iron(III) transport system permease protein [Spirilliplanes yamanashiensis]GIJ04988.1 ABC transporter permease [Spirilliplanes yamanashiensis]